MKKQNYSKAIKIIIIAALAFWLLSSCSSKSAKQREQTYDKLLFMSEDLRIMSNDAYDAYKSGNYDDMSSVLYDLYEKCEDISGDVEDIARQFDEPVYDEYAERRKWY